ncbi:polysaccharide pyruvyl transferase family protein [Polaribacter sp. R77954]|uniref:polysaccharide pyruvyl transferase family protein n=1 Tax=Polaribacter sp. R77954 TaxID=3093870 RepID=UPI0037CAC81A
MKKIGIITISRTNNYGAELQAYATQKKMQLLGYDAELIDYLYYKHRNHKETKDSEPAIAFSKKEKWKHTFLYRMVSPFYEDFVSSFVKKIKTRKENFKNFHKNNTKYSKEYKSIEELYKANHSYDVFIAGSDQIWNPSTGTSMAPYFLEFAPKDKIKMSFASSFGVSEIDEKYYCLYKNYIANLDVIGVREEDGVKLVKEISGREGTRVLDPTLLLNKEEWKEVIIKPIRRKKKYLIIYVLHESETLIKIAHYLQEKLGFEIIKLTKRAYSNAVYPKVINLEDQGPDGYIDLFMNAAFVLTNSFHGTAFSTNFNVPFFAVLNRERKNNSRMVNFLKMVGLDDRIVWEGISGFDELDVLFNLDFTNANQVLEKERKASIKYLTSNINKN